MSYLRELDLTTGRNQLPEESAEECITTLHSLLENCEYGDLTSQIISDRLGVGIRDTALSECLYRLMLT